MAKKKAGKGSKVDSLRHKDKRTNIPTEELRDFVAEDEASPKTMLYPRDPSLDPQLVWKGKDEQDQEDLAVPVVPIYIQEKIHPQALISELLRQAEDERREHQLDLFDDFNGIRTVRLRIACFQALGRLRPGENLIFNEKPSFSSGFLPGPQWLDLQSYKRTAMPKPT